MQTMSVSSDDTRTTIPKLLPNTIYEIHVAAVNSVGEGMDSKSIEGKEILTKCVSYNVLSLEDNFKETLIYVVHKPVSGVC